MDNEIIEVPVEVDHVDTTIEKIHALGYVTVPMSEVSSYGIVGNELYKMIETIRSPGGEGIYHVKFPRGAGGTLSKFHNENAFFGAIRGENGFEGQARLTQLSLNPEQVFMAIALMDISIKLHQILETQKTILEFLYAKEEAKIDGNYGMLNEAIKGYRYNWDQEKYIDQNLGLVRSIKKDMSTSIELSKKQIRKILNTPDEIHFVQSAGKKVQMLAQHIRSYYDALYTFSYATFFETLLIHNFREENLDNVSKSLTKRALEYENVFKESLSWARQYILSSINYKAAPILYVSDKAYETVLRKIPIGLDRHFKEESEYYRPVDEQIAPIKCYEKIGTSIFAEEIKKINTINNKEVDMYIDEENIYLPEANIEGKHDA